MKTNLKLFISKSIKINDADLEKILEFFTYKKVEKGSLLLKEGEIESSFYFINSGCVRTFYVNQGGHLKTRHIAFENSFISSLSSFISGKPSYEYVEAIENSELLLINRSHFFQLLNDVGSWKDFYILILEKGYRFQNEKIESYVTLTAQERYNKLIIDSPHFIQRLSNIIVASYLDISPETLSRIKKV
ncbi:MAG: Crp/Fnr family transcriptional regulator [Chitinophagia bacterium]